MHDELSAENKKALADGRARSMTDHGIGIEYHKRGLSTIPGAEHTLIPWYKEHAADVHNGRGITFVGAGLPARVAAIAVARALNLRALETYVLPLTNIVRWLERPATGGDRWRDVSAAQGIVLTGFVSFMKNRESFMTEWQTRMLEDYLSHRLENGQAVFPVAEVALAESNWYSKEFTDLVASKNMEFKA